MWHLQLQEMKAEVVVVALLTCPPRIGRGLFQEENFQVNQINFGTSQHLDFFMTILGSHPCCIDYGTSLSRILWPCDDKFQVAARANWNAIFALA